jgi:hypothetical protein
MNEPIASPSPLDSACSQAQLVRRLLGDNDLGRERPTETPWISHPGEASNLVYERNPRKFVHVASGGGKWRLRTWMNSWVEIDFKVTGLPGSLSMSIRVTRELSTDVISA